MHRFPFFFNRKISLPNFPISEAVKIGMTLKAGMPGKNGDYLIVFSDECAGGVNI
jgi:hypothetical protein